MGMKFSLNLICAGAIAGIFVACGGSSYNSSNQMQATTSVALSGTAAGGLALANAAVTIQCQGANGTTITKSDGTYTLSIAGGSLPCALTVTKNSQTLRSIVIGSGTSSTANITPLTEMLVGALLQQNPNAFSGGAPSTSITSANLAAAKQVVIDYLKGNDIDVSSLANLDFVTTPLTAATTTPGTGDTQDKVLDSLKSAGIEPAKVATSLSTAPTGCTFAKSGKYTLINYKGEFTSAMIDFVQKTIVVGDSASASFAASATYPCEFSGGTVTVNFASSGLAIFKDTGSKTIGIALPFQAFNKAAVLGDTYNMHGYFANNSGPAAVNASHAAGAFAPPNAQFGTVRINADGTAIVCGATDYSTSTDPTMCPSTTSPENAQTADFSGAVNDDGSLTIKSPDAPNGIKAFSYIAPNGTKLIAAADASSHSFLLLAKQAVIDTSKIEPNSVWYQIQGYAAYSGVNDTGSWVDNAEVNSGTALAIVTSPTQGTITLHFDDGVTPDRTDAVYWNTTTDSGATQWAGMRHRNKDTTVTPNVAARTGMTGVGMGFSTNGSVNGGTILAPTAPNVGSFSLSVKRIQN